MTSTDRRSYTAGLAALAVASLCGCVGFGSKPKIEDVEVSIVDVRSPDIGATSATLPVVLEFYNPTKTTIPDPSGEFDVFVNDTSVATAEATLNTLEPGERAKEAMDVFIEYAESGAEIARSIRDGGFTVRIEGEIASRGASKQITSQYQIR